MQQGGSEQRITSANSSPRMQHKSYSLFGLFTKRSTKVEPHPIDNSDDSNTKQKDDNHLHPTSNQRQEHDMSFAKCSPDKKPSTSIISNSVMTNHINNNVKVSNISGQTMLPNANVLNNNLNKSTSSNSSGGGGILSLQRRIKPPTSSKSKTHLHRHSTDGYQSDGGEIVFRKSPKHRSPNHNRFSHQFSLCCKAERKPLTPPVTVRYNSVADGTNALKRDNLSLSWSMVDDASISSDINNSNAAVATTSTAFFPPQQLAQQSTFGYKTLHECASAPQSPVTAKVMFNENTSHSSPSNSSVKSTQSDIPNGANSLYSAAIASTSAGAGGGPSGPIRPIAVTACRSRLRLKLLPPGKEITKQLPPFEGAPQPVLETMLRATTPQHMSSPNIASKPEVIIEQPDTDLRFMSHEDIKIRRQPPSQASGLATHALMAAQVLSLIPTEKARERSFLDGRLGSLSLMGPSELNRVIPSKEVTIFVGTWNMNGQSPPKQMNDFVLPTAIEHVPDIVVIGTQESSPDRFGWEVTIQETLGPTHVLFHSTALGTLHLAVYMRRDLIWYCSAPEDASMSVRTGSAFRTKGAVAISFCLFGTSMLFVTSHLTAHQQKVKERVSDVKRIIHALDLPKNLQLRHKNKDVTQNFDNVFWCGDLNFRLSEPREKLLEWIQTTKFPLPSHLPHGYMHTDQLSSVLADGAAFRGFMEANITFPPTYKYDPGTQFFDTSTKQRAPAYTDRILYKYRQTQGLVMRRQSTVMGVSTPLQPYIQCLLYDSVPSIITSDHKPVLALFKVSIRAGTDSIPLAAGLFNRDIFLEGMKRRLNNQYSGSSAVCAIQ